MKLMLGTAQFGRDYGIANKVGKVPYHNVVEIMRLAADNGIVHIDTACDYGDSETTLGKVKEELGIDLKVSTKLYEEFDKTGPQEILIKIECALERLKVDKLDSLLVHQPYWLLDDKHSDFVYGMLLVAKGMGLTKKIGVSVGDPQEAVDILERYKLDVVQVPYNLLDQRLMDPRIMNKLASRELYVRSVFLQGLLLVEPDELVEYFDPIKDTLRNLRQTAEQNNMSMLQMCLKHAMSSRFVDNVIVGVESVEQLSGILNACRGQDPERLHLAAINDPKFINPGFWPVGGWWK